MGKHISGQLSARVSLRGIAITAAAILAVGTLATTSAVSRHASADTAPVGGLPATVSADVLPTEQINGVAWAQVTVGNTVYVTGSFSQARPAGVAVGGAGSVTRSNLLAYDITTGNLITSFNHSLNAQGLAIAASPNGSTVYVVGDFTKVDGADPQPHRRLLHLHRCADHHLHREPERQHEGGHREQLHRLRRRFVLHRERRLAQALGGIFVSRRLAIVEPVD